MNSQSFIDEAMQRAKARLGGGAMKKEASTENDLIKEANNVADALEYVAFQIAGDGTAAGVVRQSMLQEHFKAAADAAGPAVTPAQSKGEQSQVPDGSKKKIQPGGSPSQTNPTSSTAPEGVMPQDILRQMPPSVKTPPKDSEGKKASLYDILMNSKTAFGGEGPAEMDSEQPAPGIPDSNENKNRQSILGSNEAPVSATKRDAKLPTRARLAEVWNSATDTTGDASARAVWPGAAAKGEIKVSSADEMDEKGKGGKGGDKKGPETNTAGVKGEQPSGAKKASLLSFFKGAEDEKEEKEEDKGKLKGFFAKKKEEPKDKKEEEAEKKSSFPFVKGAEGEEKPKSGLKGLGRAAGGTAGGAAAGALGGYGAMRGLVKTLTPEEMARLAAEHGMSVSEAARGARLGGGLLGLGAGAGLGLASGLGYHAWKKHKEQAAAQQKESSLIEYSALFDLAANGQLGKEAQAALNGICVGANTPMDSMKVAAEEMEDKEKGGSKKRLAELLKKREDSSTDSGSASPESSKTSAATDEMEG